MAQSNSGQRDGRAEYDQVRIDGQASGREQGYGELAGYSQVDSVADADMQHEQSAQPHEARSTDAGRGCENMRTGPTNGQWADADWLRCTDGQWRAVEPALLRVADGFSGELVHSGAFVPASSPLAQKADDRRVMRLKGYGNAINVAQAAAFVRAAA